jgi:hypothetical protein
MAYGKNKERKDWLYKAVPLGIGEITPEKSARLLELRQTVLTLMREMSTACFIQEPLKGVSASKEIEAKLIILQKSASFNAVWSQEARMRVKPALENTLKLYFKRLFGGLRFVDSLIPKSQYHAIPLKPKFDANNQLIPPPAQRKYYQVPVSIQDFITPEELQELKFFALSNQAKDIFESVIVNNDYLDLTDRQILIIKDIHRRAQQKHTCPDFGVKEAFTLQLHIDARMLQTGHKAEAIELRQGVPFLLEDEQNKKYFRFLDLSGIKAREDRIRIPLVLTTKIARRIKTTENNFASLIVEVDILPHLNDETVAAYAERKGLPQGQGC